MLGMAESLAARQILGPSWRDPLTGEHVGERFQPLTSGSFTSISMHKTDLLRTNYFLYSFYPVVHLFTQFNSHQCYNERYYGIEWLLLYSLIKIVVDISPKLNTYRNILYLNKL